MELQDGSAIGPYQIVSRLGAGGMGEVFRAHDQRLGRDIAVKILPADVADDPERLERFEREARASAALDHPNIVAVHDIGRDGDVTYVVMELLEGATLRQEIDSRPPTTRKAVEWTVGIAEGLAAAHARGIVHRDIKPENLFVTVDGRIKILDFGIARVAVAGQDAPEAATAAAGTEPGKILGTAGYMSPEQVRGEVIDARSDIFSLGAVLYEMLAGERAFSGDTAVETLHAVLKTDPPELTSRTLAVPPSLEHIVRRCLEKRAAERFHSAHDLALALEAVAGSHTQPGVAISAASTRPRRWASWAAVAVLVAAAAGVTSWWAGAPPDSALPSIRQITARRGAIDAARFASGGESVVYSARYGGAPAAPFEQNLNSPESQRIGPDNAMLFAHSDGALALGLRPRRYSGSHVGTLATLQAGASAARELAERIRAADFVGGGVAAIEQTGNGSRLHFPLGTIVEDSVDYLELLRGSPDGTAIAFWRAGEGINLLDTAGRRRVLEAPGVSGLSWAPSGERVWFSSTNGRGESTLWSAEPGEQPRERWRFAGAVVLEDIADDGRVLVRSETTQRGTIVITPGATDPVDLSWLDRSEAVAISAATSSLLFNDAGGFYLRGLDGSAAVRLGPGIARAISSSGDLVLSLGGPDRFQLTPVGIGTPRELLHPGVESYFAWFHPDGRRVLFNGREEGGTWRYFAMDLDGTGAVTRIEPDNLEHYIGQQPMSSDGKWLIGYPLPGRVHARYSVAGDATIPVQGLEPGDVVIRFAEGDREIYVFNREQLPARIYRLDYRTGERRLWREFMPGDPTGITGFPSVAMTADGRFIAFNYERVLSTLFEISGLQEDG